MRWPFNGQPDTEINLILPTLRMPIPFLLTTSALPPHQACVAAGLLTCGTGVAAGADDVIGGDIAAGTTGVAAAASGVTTGGNVVPPA